MNNDIKTDEIKNIIKDEIKIEGFVEIKNGETVIKAKNKFVQTLLQTILNFLSAYRAGYNCYDCVHGPADSTNSVYKIYLGTDTGTPTAYNTTALASPIGTPPGTAPKSIAVSQTNPSNGVFQINITALWDANTISGTVGEMGIYMNLAPYLSLNAFGWSSTYTPNNATLASRLAAADLVFTPFTINTSNPLTIVWTIQLSFA